MVRSPRIIHELTHRFRTVALLQRRAPLLVVLLLAVVAPAYGQVASPALAPGQVSAWGAPLTTTPPAAPPPPTGGYPVAGAADAGNLQPFDPYSPPTTTDPYAVPTVPPLVPLNPPPIVVPVIPPAAAPPILTPNPIVPPVYGNPPVYATPPPAIGAQSGGLYAGFEAPILQPRIGTLSIVNLVQMNPNYDLTFSTRFTVGYQGPEGFGLRFRWWHFDKGTDANVRSFLDLDAATAGNTKLKVDALDFEVAQDGKFRTWAYLFSGGVRYTQLRFDYDFIIDDDGFPPDGNLDPNTDTSALFTSKYTHVGPTISLAARRPFGDWEGLAFVGNVRLSFLFGTAEAAGTLNGDSFPLFKSEDVMPVWETQIGLEWSRILQSGKRFYIGGFFEGQAWEWTAPSTLGGDLGFWGPTFTIGWAR